MISLRVCAITFDWYPFDVLVRRTAEAAADAGYQVDVICLRQPGQKAHEICHGVQVYRIPMYRSFGRSSKAIRCEDYLRGARCLSRIDGC
ncbi:MAG: hypothetical protein E6J10_09260 [Chloroflexi bacterium]|nr:MAG: hypothetical protein E6J10_09260 [Chloroflexota bacterium]